MEVNAHVSVDEGRHLVPEARTTAMEMTNKLHDMLVVIVVTGLTLGTWTGQPARADGPLLPTETVPGRPPPEAILDQASPPQNWALNGTHIWQQGVTAGVSGPLIGVEVQRSWEAGSSLFFINLGEPWQTDPNDFEARISIQWAQTWEYIDVSSANIYLQAGDKFVIGFGEGYPWFIGNHDKYSRGSVWMNGREHPDTDLAFRTYTIPEPSALAFVAVNALVLLRARRQ